MILRELTHRATLTPSDRWIRKHQRSPGNQEYAVRAAIQKARKLDKTIVVIKGNSYGHLVYHLALTHESIAKHVPGAWPCRVLVVKRTGEIFQAMAHD